MAIFFMAFGWCVGKPLTYLIRWINQLSERNYSQPQEHFRQPSEGSLPHNNYRYPYILYKELFDRMTQLSNQLLQSETERLNMEVKKQEWIASISHDLKTPLSYIEGYAHMLAAADYDWTDEEKQNFSRQISGKTMEMKQLIHDLNQTGRWSVEQFPMNRKSDDIVNFLRDMMIDIANHPLAENASFMFTTEKDVCLMDFDRKLLGRAFQNVLMNAVIHNPFGTQVKCDISIKGNKCFIVIEDDGNGIEDTILRQVLDQSGKGIAIANAFVEAHSGRMSILPADSKGTRVEFVLPISP
ncbi:sensor histidine kinase [Paenibacillus lautus]|uniref:sensor histidine kinase n=1 Tax=Paenibacillus lautus TaxID=1401 RepID=UPI00209E1E85|nr:HAMP domain-containing sensor histidine kinase [Paenibacillus lautus]